MQYKYNIYLSLIKRIRIILFNTNSKFILNRIFDIRVKYKNINLKIIIN